MTHAIAKVLTRYFCLLLTFVCSTTLVAQPRLSVYVESGNTTSEQFEILTSQQDSRCQGDSAGAINLFFLGGFEPFEFEWNDGTTDQNRTNLTAGVYSVTVTDVTEATQSISVTIADGTSPSLTLTSIAATCASNVANADGQLKAISFSEEDRFDYTPGSSYAGSATTPDGLPPIPPDGILANNLPNPTATQPYTVRVFNERGCFKDVTTILSAASCQCPPIACIPVMIKRSK